MESLTNKLYSTNINNCSRNTFNLIDSTSDNNNINNCNNNSKIKLNRQFNLLSPPSMSSLSNSSTSSSSSSSTSSSSSSTTSFCFLNESNLKYSGDTLLKKINKQDQFTRTKLFISDTPPPPQPSLPHTNEDIIQINQSDSISSLSSCSSTSSDSSLHVDQPATTQQISLRFKLTPYNESNQSNSFRNSLNISNNDWTAYKFNNSNKKSGLNTIRNSMFINNPINSNNNGGVVNKNQLEHLLEKYSVEISNLKRDNSMQSEITNNPKQFNNNININNKNSNLVCALTPFTNNESNQIVDKKKSIIRSISCLNSKNITTEKHYHQHEKQQQILNGNLNRREQLHQRRQRHLTTSLSNNENINSSAFYSKIQQQQQKNSTCNFLENYFEDFLESLDDINKYLDKKITQNTTQNHSTKQHFKRTKRNLTQPILFTNELSKLSNKIKLNEQQQQQHHQHSQTRTLINKTFNFKMNNETNTPSIVQIQQLKTSIIKPKKFISLSDILNSKTTPQQEEISKEDDLTSTSTATLSKTKFGTSNTLNDFLTVQELFKELELDCDEQIKILDEKERTQKEISLKQKEILDQLKQNWFSQQQLLNSQQNSLLTTTTSSLSLNNHNLKLVKQCNCYTRKEKLNNLRENKLRKSSNLNLKKKRKKSFLFILSNSNNRSNSDFSSNQTQIALLKLNKKIFVLKNTNSRIKQITVLHVNKFKKSLVYSSSYSQLFKLKNILNLELFNLKTNFNKQTITTKTNSNKLIKQQQQQQSNQTNTLNNNNKLDKQQQQTLLDKYYEKYCNSTITFNNNKKPILLNLDTSSEYLSTSLSSSSSAPLSSSSSTNSSMYSTNLKKAYETNEMKNIESNNNRIKEDTQTINSKKTTSRLNELNSTFDMIRSSQYGLQDCDLDAIYRRLEVLYSSASKLNFDYKYVKENYLNNIEDDEYEEEDANDDEYEGEEEEYFDNYDYLNEENKLARKRIINQQLPPLYLDEDYDENINNNNNIANEEEEEEEQSSSSVNLSSEDHSPNLPNLTMTATKLNQIPITNNKFVCIEFPLNNNNKMNTNHRQSLTETLLNKKHKNLNINNNINQDNTICLNRFHSFRLNDKLINVEESNLATSSNLSKSYLDLTKSDETNSSIKQQQEQPNQALINKFPLNRVDSNKFELKKSSTNEKLAASKGSNRTATVVISLKSNNSNNSIKRKDSNLTKIKKTKTDKLMINKDSSETYDNQMTTNEYNYSLDASDYKHNNHEKVIDSNEITYEKLPIIELTRSNFCQNLCNNLSNESSNPFATSTAIAENEQIKTKNRSNSKLTESTIQTNQSSAINSEQQTPTIHSTTTTVVNSSKQNDKQTKIAAVNANLLAAVSSSVSGIFNTATHSHLLTSTSASTPHKTYSNLSFKNKSIESSIKSLSPTKQLTKPQTNSISDFNNNTIRLNETKDSLKRVDANYLNLDSISTIDITLNKKKQQSAASSLLFLLNNSNSTNNRSLNSKMNVSDENILFTDENRPPLVDSSTELINRNEPNQEQSQQQQQQPINTNKRERCDSGVGGSLTRDPSKKKNKEKWSSFIKSHRPSFKTSASHLQMNNLSVKQYCKLKKFALVRITALMEKYSQACQKSGWTRFKTVPKFIKRHQKSIDQNIYKNKHVFGVPLKLNFQRHGQPLPQPIIQLMKYLRRNSTNTVGIFRKSGSKIRMSLLRDTIERFSSTNYADFEKQINSVYCQQQHNDINSCGSGFSSQSTSKSDLVDDINIDKFSLNTDIISIDVADILKQYFRELPECLFTNKLSQTLIDIFTYMPENERLEAVQYCMLLLDDENRDVLQCLLYFLHDISLNHSVHKMDARNIAICLAPTLLNLTNLKETNPTSYMSPTSSPTGPAPTSFKDSTHLMSRHCNASLDCLTLMIEMPKKIFQIPNEAYTKCQFSKQDLSVSLSLNELLGAYSLNALNIHLNDRIDEMIKELKDKARNWTRFRHDSNVEISFKIIEDEYYPLRLWKLTIEIDAQPSDIFTKLLKYRHEWDDDLSEFRIIESLTGQTDIYQYSMHLMAPQPSRDFCELRTWKEMNTINAKYQYVVYSQSIEHEKALELGDIRGNTVRNFYLIESNSSSDNKCKLHQIFRADYRGYSSEWYHKTQGFILKRNLINLKECLKSNCK